MLSATNPWNTPGTWPDWVDTLAHAWHAFLNTGLPTTPRNPSVSRAIPRAIPRVIRFAAECQPTETVATDHQLVTLTLGGDTNAFGHIVGRHQAEIARYLWRFTRDPHSHADLVQTTFVRAFLKLRQYRAKAPLAHWLRVIATREGYRFWRTASRDRSRREQFARSDLAPDQSNTTLDAAEEVHYLLAGLPPSDRLVLSLFYLEEKSIAEIAELTGWTESRVKVTAHRARVKLKELVARERRKTDHGQ